VTFGLYCVSFGKSILRHLRAEERKNAKKAFKLNAIFNKLDLKSQVFACILCDTN
jgi:hypothetical protein